jgi:hypothetical protein
MNYIEIISNAIGLFWLLTESKFNIHFIYYALTGKLSPNRRPFNCDFCLMFWCGIIASFISLLPLISFWLMFISLPIALAFLTNKYNNEH